MHHSEVTDVSNIMWSLKCLLCQKEINCPPGSFLCHLGCSYHVIIYRQSVSQKLGPKSDLESNHNPGYNYALQNIVIQTVVFKKSSNTQKKTQKKTLKIFLAH